MSESVTRHIAAWSSALQAAEIPRATATRAGWQWASVLGSILAGGDHPLSRAIGAVVERERSTGPCTLLPEMTGAPPATAVWANAARSVLLDFDDYLFAGHTGHSSVLVTLAVGELVDASGPDLLAATVAGNEVGGRLGASMLLGPHNGQMWAYIHNVAGAVSAARVLRLGEPETAHAIGLALTLPPNPLTATFMGSDGKAFTASGPAVDGMRGALLAAEGFRCEVDVLEDRNGFWPRVHPDAHRGMFSGLGQAWVTDSLSYKVHPGCAYLDTAVDAVLEILDERRRAGAPVAASDVVGGRIRAGLLTSGMEAMSGWYRHQGAPRTCNVTFSASWSVAIALVAGRLTPSELDSGWLASHEAELSRLAAALPVEMDGEMNRGIQAGAGGFDVLDALSRGRTEPVLEGASFADYSSAFPAAVDLELTDGTTLTAKVDIPRGGAGRPEAETRRLVAAKLEANGAAPGSFDLLADLAALDGASAVRRALRAKPREGASHRQ